MKTILKLTLLIIMISCRDAETISADEKNEIIKEVHVTLDNYYNDIKESGLIAEFKYLDNSPDFAWLPPGCTVPISYDSVATILRLNAPLFTSIENSFDTLKITPLTRKLATYTGRLNSVMRDTTGKMSKLKLVETGIMIKRKEGWKLLSGQTSMVVQN